MLALRTAPPVFSVAEAERIARDAYGLAVSVRPLSGERDCNFRLHTADGHEYVLKIIDLEAGEAATDCQVRVLRHVAEQDPSLPVPSLVATLRGEDVGSTESNGDTYATCLMGFLPGRLLAEQPADAPLLERTGGTLARLDHALRGFFHPALAQRLAWDVRRLPELAAFSPYLDSAALRHDVERACALFKERLTALHSLRSQAIHGDGHGHNLLVGPDRCISGILDFGDMIHAPLVLELAVAMSELLADGAADVPGLVALVRGYAQRLPLESGEIEALYELILARHAVTLLVHAWRGRHDARGAQALERSAAGAARSLGQLLRADRAALTRAWHEAAGPRATLEEPPGAIQTVDLRRRHRLMGAGAELFYERPLQFVRGSGVWLYDPAGQAYLDVYNNVPHVGHTHPTVVRAIQQQTARLATHTRYLHDGILEYAERLTATLPAHLDTCIFVNSGSEANDVAWRIAQMHTGGHGGLVMQHAYHGITDAVAALTPSTGESRDPKVVTLGVPPAESRAHAPLSAAGLAAVRQDVDQAIETLSGRGFAPAAFFIDTALTSSGIFDPPPEWAAAVAAPIRAAGALIVADEVQYGLGRCGAHLWGFARRGFEPDIVTLGKPVANGYPMGVVVANRALIEAFQAKFGFFSTFGGNPVAAAAALAVLEVLEAEQLMANARSTGEYLRRQLTALAARHSGFGEVYGTGLLLGLQVNASAHTTARQRAKAIINHLAAESRVLIGYEGAQADILKLRPPLPFLPEHADRLVAALGAAAGAVGP